MDIEDTMLKLINELNAYTKAYDEGHPLISDQEWDEKYFLLLRMEEEAHIRLSNSPTQKVDYQVVNKLEKVQHNHPMLSLSKSKDIEVLKKFIGDQRAYIMLKMDGLTCSLRYLNGRLVSGETRGDGEIGELITHNIKMLPSVPKAISFQDELIVDGEIICDYNHFEEWEDEYSNPRNMAAGAIRLLDSAESAKYNLTFIAWDVIKGFDEEKSLAKRLERLKQYDFTCVDGFLSDEIDFETAVEELKMIAAEKAYPIDGIVVKYDDVDYYYSKGRNGHDFCGGKALKFYDEEYETRLRDIEWQVGRTGVLSPVAVFDEVDLDGALTNKASLFNVDIIQTYLHKPFIGQKIRVARMNMVIPRVMWGEERIEVEKSINMPTICPSCGEKLEMRVSDAGVHNLYCINPGCQGILLNKIDYFCGKAGLDIKGISTAILSQLIDWGWVQRYDDLFTLCLHYNEWIKKPGFSVTSVKKILAAINEAKNCELWRFISAIGISLIGPNVAKEIAKREKTWADFLCDINKQFDFTLWDSFGEETNKAIYDYNYSQLIELIDIFNFQNSLFIETECRDLPLTKLSFCVTGNLHCFENRDDFKAKIEQLGGKVVNSVSKKVSALINNDKDSESSKNVTAKKIGVPILTEEEFLKKYEEIKI